MNAKGGTSNRRFASDVLKLSTGAVVAQAIGILLSPIFTRLFAPEAYGTAAVFASILGVVSVVVCLRYEFAIMLPQDDDDAGHLLAVSLLSTFGWTFLSGLFTFLGGKQLCELLNAPELSQYLWLLPIAVFVQGCWQALRSWNTRTRHFGMLSGTQVATAASTSAAKLGAGLLGHVDAGVIIATNLIGQAAAALPLGIQAYRTLRDRISQITWAGIVSQAKRYRKFPLTDSWSGVLNSLSAQLPIVMLSALFTQDAVGHYSLSHRVIQLPMTLVGTAIAQVFFQRASEARHEGNLHVIVQGTFRRLVSLGLFPLLTIGLIGEEAFVVVFGAAWAEAGVYAQIVSLWRFFVFIGSPMSTLFGVLERQEVFLVFNIVLFSVRAIALVAGGAIGTPRAALALYAISGLILWVWLVHWVLKASRASTQRALRDLGRCLLYASPVLLMLAAAKWWWSWPVWAILLTAVVGSVGYYLVTVWQDPSLMDFLRGIQNRLHRKES